MSWQTKVKFVDYTEPGPMALEHLSKFLNNRYAVLWDLKPIDGKCAWCNSNQIPKRKKKYCSDLCSESAYAWTNPQKYAKAFLLKRQQFACVGCGISFEEILEKKVKDIFRRSRLSESDTITDWRLTYCCGELFHVDHIEPIHKGGVGIGFKNVQILCPPCHHKKSGQERRREI